MVALIGAGLSFRGAKKRKKAAAKARREYEAAVASYEAEARKALADQRMQIAAMADKTQGITLEQLRNMPADQTAALQQSALNQQAALTAPQAALSGPLGEQYAQEFAGRAQSALAPMALNYAENDVAQAAIANDRRYDLQRAALAPEYDRYNMQFGLGDAARNQALNRAGAKFGVNAGGGNAGSEQMMYGGMLSALAGTGTDIAKSYAADARYENQRNSYYDQLRADVESRTRGQNSVGVLRPQNQSALYPYNTGMR